MSSRGQDAGVRVFEAIYEDGVLKPVADPGLPEHRRFAVEVRDVEEVQGKEGLRRLSEGPSEDLASLELAALHRVYEGLSEEDLAAVEEIALDRSHFSRGQPE